MSDPDIAKLTAERIALEMFGKGIVPSDAHAHAAKLIVEAHLAPILARNAAMEAVLMECRAFVADTAHTEFLLSMFSRTAEGMAKHGAIASAWESLLSRIDALTAKGAGQ